MRLDQALVACGLAASRSRAQALVADGAVAVNGAVVRKAAHPVGAGDALELVAEPMPWVSRAGLKLAHALDHFGLSPQGAVALDLGASTGGFTQVLLARGAAEVFALDVGHGQMAPVLRVDTRVHVLEGVNARAIPPGRVPQVGWIVSDLSFISLTKALPCPLSLAAPGAHLVALIKPQFELSPGEIGKGGVVRDGGLHTKACASVTGFLSASGWEVAGVTPSPIAGGDGNVEFLVAAKGPG